MATRWQQLERTAPQPVRQVIAAATRAPLGAAGAGHAASDDVDREALLPRLSALVADRAPTFCRADLVPLVADVAPPVLRDPDALSELAEQ